MARVVVFCLGEDSKVIVYICDGMYEVSLLVVTRHRRALAGAKGFFRNSMKFMNGLALGLSVLDMFSDNPDTFFNQFGTPKEGNIYRNPDGGYYSINNREFQKNEDGEIKSVTATVTLYRDYRYNEETRKYEGVGQYDQATVKQYTGKKAQEVFRNLQETY